MKPGLGGKLGRWSITGGNAFVPGSGGGGLVTCPCDTGLEISPVAAAWTAVLSFV